MKIHFLSLLFFLTSNFSLTHAAEKLEWIENEINLGIIEESNGPVVKETGIVNTGRKSVSILKSVSSCGCTEVSYPSGKIQGGDTAIITFTFDPTRKFGKFLQEIELYVTDEKKPVTLEISGIVMGNKETLGLAYPFQSGNLRLERDYLKTDTLVKGMKRHLFIELYNQSHDTLQPQIISTDPGLVLKIEPSAISPGEDASLVCEIDSDSIGFYGKGIISGKILPDVSSSDTVDINVSTMIMPKIDDLNSSLGNYGLLNLENNYVMVRLDKNGDFECGFEIHNTGTGPLHIYAISDESNILKKGSFTDTMQPGDSQYINLSLHRKDIPKGPFRINCDIISDDPFFPLQTIRIVGIN
ncbi:MAG: DUF1573 domain-containing protein [Muribaculaceae bacterium]|nr:DUF1573 domain-containing protein [Muribaculaceae bacterium]